MSGFVQHAYKSSGNSNSINISGAGILNELIIFVDASDDTTTLQIKIDNIDQFSTPVLLKHFMEHETRAKTGSIYNVGSHEGLRTAIWDPSNYVYSIQWHCNLTFSSSIYIVTSNASNIEHIMIARGILD